jgi:hypothetical protein
MKHAARAECYGRGMGSSLAYPIPEFNEKHAKELHVLLTKNSTLVNVRECGEDNDEEVYLNMVTGEDEMPKGKA